MCGIHASLSTQPHIISNDLNRSLSNRGPDHFGQVERKLGRWTLKLTSTVLALRGGGGHVTPQPLVELACPETGSALCWNGEAWRVDGHDLAEGNDGEVLFGMMRETGKPLDVLRRVEGPFAFVYYNEAERTVYYGRDRLGRRSLMTRFGEDGELVFCSVAEDGTGGWKEVEADGIYAASVGKDGELEMQRHEWVVEEGAEDYVSTTSALPFFSVAGVI